MNLDLATVICAVFPSAEALDAAESHLSGGRILRVTGWSDRGRCACRNPRLMPRIAGTQLGRQLVRCFEVFIRRESANEGIDSSLDNGVEIIQQLIVGLIEDKGFL